eukprot:1348005-Amorphochlora_amoeboformis.AAC.2
MFRKRVTLGAPTSTEPLLNEDEPTSEQHTSEGQTEEYDAIVLYDYEAKEGVQLTVSEKDIVRIRKVYHCKLPFKQNFNVEYQSPVPDRLILSSGPSRQHSKTCFPMSGWCGT